MSQPAVTTLYLLALAWAIHFSQHPPRSKP